MQRTYRNLNEALPDLVEGVAEYGERMDSRNGPVISLTAPIIVTTTNPWERVCFIKERKANPFLFLLDGLSVLSCVTAVSPLAGIVPRMADFSDDGISLRGHYGSRLYDLIPDAVGMLKSDPNTRRVVMSIWDNDKDLGTVSKDIPCNLMVVPRLVDRQRDWSEDHKFVTELDLTVFNRSNDLFWGMMGANVVQFSFLQELMALELKVGVGHLHQISTNLHFYTGFGPGRKVDLDGILDGQYHPFWTPDEEYPTPARLNYGPGGFDIFRREVDVIFLWRAGEYKAPTNLTTPFLTDVVVPMLTAFDQKSAAPLEGKPDCDWFMAARIWLAGE